MRKDSLRSQEIGGAVAAAVVLPVDEMQFKFLCCLLVFLHFHHLHAIRIFGGPERKKERERERERVCVCVLAAGRTVASYLLLITVLHSDDGFFGNLFI
jgi:hypothetical protein